MEKLIRSTVSDVLRLDVSEEKLQVFLQFVKFGLVGASNTLISYAIYSGVLILAEAAKLTARFPRVYLVGSVLGFVASVAWSFFWNNRHVFALKEGEKRSVFLSLMKTYVSYAFSGLFLSNALLLLWIEVFRVSRFLAPVLNLLFTVPVNFLVNKFWAFKVCR